MLKHILDECILCTHIFCTNNSIVIKLIWINTTEEELGFFDIDSATNLLGGEYVKNKMQDRAKVTNKTKL